MKKLKWLIFKLFCTYYHLKPLRNETYGFLSAWNYADSFFDWFVADDLHLVKFKDLAKEAEYYVSEDFSCWAE